MKKQHSAADRPKGILGRLAGGVGYLLMLGTTCLLAMAVSYFAVLNWARGDSRNGQPGQAALDEARQLRDFSNELLALTAQYLDQVGNQPAEQSGAFREWLDEQFGPGINDLRRRMLAPESSGESLSGLLAASGKVAAMAANPDQEGLRQDAVEAVLDTTAAAEARIRALGVSKYLSEPAGRLESR